MAASAPGLLRTLDLGQVMPTCMSMISRAGMVWVCGLTFELRRERR